VFSICAATLREYRGYHRDDAKKVVEDGACLMRALRYWSIAGKEIAAVQPATRTAVTQITAADRQAGY
jgi:selenophosphate synthase